MKTNWVNSKVVQLKTWFKKQSEWVTQLWNTTLATSTNVADILTVQERNIVNAQEKKDNYTFIVYQWWLKFKATVPLSINEIESPDNEEFTLEEIAKNKYPDINPLFDPKIESTFTELWIDWEDWFIYTDLENSVIEWEVDWKIYYI